MNHRLGCLPDYPDQRDHRFSLVAPPPTAPLPDVVDLRSICPPVVDQGDLGSCTANALAGAIGCLEIKDGIAFDPVSRLFIYYNERSIEHTVGSDSGAMIRDGIKSLVKLGVCDETAWPYVIQQFTDRPPTAAFTAALTHRLTAYARLETQQDMLVCLAAGFPYVAGITVYESFESPEVAKTGIVPMPEPGERTLGGHAILVVGYNQPAATFLCRNSWGDTFGMGGYFTLPTAYLTNSDLSSDQWTVRREAGF